MIRRSTAPSLKGMSDDHDRLLQYRQQTHGPSFPCPPATRRRYRGSERDLGNTDASEVITGEFRRGQGMPWLSNGAEGSKALDRTHCCSRSNNSNEPFSGFLRERLFERPSCLSSAWPASSSLANTSTSSSDRCIRSGPSCARAGWCRTGRAKTHRKWSTAKFASASRWRHFALRHDLTDGHPGGRVTSDKGARLPARPWCAIRVRLGWASVRSCVTTWPAMPQPCMSDLAGPAESKPSRPESMATISRAPISFRQWTHH
jgi:hypothetical protein